MPDREKRAEEQERIQLSVAQIAASSLAAVSAAVVCSFFGVAGTVIGTAAASIVATTGSALYSYSLRRTRARLRRLHQAGAAAPPITEVLKTTRQQGQRLLGQIPLRLLGAGVVVVFVVSIGVVTIIEYGTGKPLSSVVGATDKGSGTSLFGTHAATHKPTPKPSPSTSASSPATSSPSARPSPSGTHTSTTPPEPTPTATSPTAIISSILSPSANPTQER